MNKIFFKLLCRIMVIVTLTISTQQSFGQEIPVFKWANATHHLNCYAGIDIIITASDAVGNAYMMGGFATHLMPILVLGFLTLQLIIVIMQIFFSSNMIPTEILYGQKALAIHFLIFPPPFK